MRCLISSVLYSGLFALVFSVSGEVRAEGPVYKPIRAVTKVKVGPPLERVSLNPQPLPPRYSLSMQVFSPRSTWALLNPQPLPPRTSAHFLRGMGR